MVLRMSSVKGGSSIKHEDEIGLRIEHKRARQLIHAAAIRQAGEFIVRFRVRLHRISRGALRTF